MNKKRILIIAAMANVELNYLLEKLKDKKEEHADLCTFYTGKMKDLEIIMCNSKIGIINATAAIVYAIEKYHPDIIINEGCAGGCTKNLNVGDVVIGLESINITSTKSKFRDIGEGSNLEDWDLVSFISGEKDRLIPQTANKELVDYIRKIDFKYNYGTVHYGIIGSGDIWNYECDRILYLNKKYGMLCEEMESIAIYTIANIYKIPAIGIKVNSDNPILKQEYDKNVCLKAQEFTELVLENIEEIQPIQIDKILNRENQEAR